ncbi:hypothetical protein [Gelidibacter gilvus]|uniref:GlsB/YeaQ/YmgE family stress response membrane protein n=1 Tax=Gelidibacter gilvus TaxID=59602 RepID=A0A4Q0XG42_9FLAO|nr:hypothetical protein [Gelidibacter gilvus]RXJ49683.1 hypothetical protein ESZ48_11825 [Gelidibacter gilvus]
MTDTLIALISIFMGIIGAHVFAAINKKHTLGLIGNTMAGVFGSIFFIKTFGRLGFDPMSIMEIGETNRVLFTINILVSIVGGAIGVIAIKLIKNKLNA